MDLGKAARRPNRFGRMAREGLFQADHSLEMNSQPKSQNDDLLRLIASLMLEFMSSSLPSPRCRNRITATQFASLLLGAASALMMVGSMAFFIGFVMMPFVGMLSMIAVSVGVMAHFDFSRLWSFCRS